MINYSDCVVIIPHLGADEKQEYALEHCIYSLKEVTPDLKIILATNGKTDCKHKPEAHVNLYDQGQCKAVNAAVSITKEEWIFISNDDMVYPFKWWEKLTHFEKWNTDFSKKILCVSPKLIEPNQAHSPTFIHFDAGKADGSFEKMKFYTYVSELPKVEPLYKTGFNLPFLIRRDLWETIGGYDILYDPWGSNGDSDLEYRIKLAGIQPYQAQNSYVYHFSQTSGTFTDENKGWWNKNWDYFIDKWGFPRTDDGIWEASFQIPEERRFRPRWENIYAV